jgi:hypothetical protein
MHSQMYRNFLTGRTIGFKKKNQTCFVKFFSTYPNIMPNTRRFLSAASFSPEHRRTYRPQVNASCLKCRQPIRGVVYPRVLNRQRRAVRQLLFARALATSNLASKCHCLHYCVGDVFMPARFNNSSRHALSAIYPGVKSVV